MKKTAVYDLPTRLFHWLFALLFVAAFLIANTADDESPLFSYHMLAGLTMIFLLVMRVIWGFAGTAYARFSSFKLNPAELIQYIKDSVFTKTKQYAGHNPASSYAAIVMFACITGLAVTGILMTGTNGKEVFEEIHELLANLFLVTVIAHVLGIILHHFRHRDALWSSMMDGKKVSILAEMGITGMKPFAGILFILLSLSWMGYLKANYNSNTQTLNLLGSELRLGEQEDESNATMEHEDHEEENDDDD